MFSTPGTPVGGLKVIDDAGGDDCGGARRLRAEERGEGVDVGDGEVMIMNTNKK